MKKVPLAEIKDGMILAKPIIGSDGKILLAEGEELKSKLASRLRNWGVVIAFILEEGEEAVKEDNTEKDSRLKDLEATFEGVLENPRMNTLYHAVRHYVQNKE